MDLAHLSIPGSNGTALGEEMKPKAPGAGSLEGGGVERGRG